MLRAAEGCVSKHGCFARPLTTSAAKRQRRAEPESSIPCNHLSLGPRLRVSRWSPGDVVHWRDATTILRDTQPDAACAGRVPQDEGRDMRQRGAALPSPRKRGEGVPSLRGADEGQLRCAFFNAATRRTGFDPASHRPAKPYLRRPVTRPNGLLTLAVRPFGLNSAMG